MSSGFPIPAEPVEVEEVIKRSRFITVIEPVTSAAAARAFHSRMRELHPEARHHCLAFNAGPPNSTRDIGCSDDGEPAGSAGRPMLNVVLGADVGQFAAVVIRYYGGTKLGVGGLVRAYAGGVKLALEALQTKPYIPQTTVELQVDYADMPLVEHLLGQHHGVIIDQQFAAQIQLSMQLPQQQLSSFADALAQRSAGRIRLPLD